MSSFNFRVTGGREWSPSSLLLSSTALVSGLGRRVEVVHGSLALGDASHDGALESPAFEAVWVEADALLRGALHTMDHNTLLELGRHLPLEPRQVVLRLCLLPSAAASLRARSLRTGGRKGACVATLAS